jgi:hypothetical protein
LGNLHDFDPAIDAVCTAELPLLERFILHRLDAATEELTTAYDSLNFAKVQTVLMQVLPNEPSAPSCSNNIVCTLDSRESLRLKLLERWLCSAGNV